MSATAPELDRVQRWFFEAISHPEGIEPGLVAAEGLMPGGANSLEELIEPSTELTATERMDVYASMYFWRLVDILVEDFSGVMHAMGDCCFRGLATDYLVAHPSTHYSLTMLGAAFPEYLRSERGELANHVFLSELAELERAIEVVFDAPRAEAVPLDALLSIPAESWPQVRFTLIPAFQLLAFEYPTNEYFQAVREDSDPEIPGLRGAWTSVFRRDYVVWRADLDRERYLLLAALQEGKTLGEAIELVASQEDVDLEALVGSLGEWFKDWTSDGYFSSVEIDGD